MTPYYCPSCHYIYPASDARDKAFCPDWQKPMKEFLTGDIRFIDRDMVAFDTDIIRYADVIWIQTNAISHKMYYKIMDAVRKWRIPVKYFLYASARKCAEQIVLEEKE